MVYTTNWSFFKPYLGEQIKFEPILYSLFYEIVYLNKSINLPLLAKSSSLASQLYKLYIYKIFYLFLFMGLRGLRKDHLAYFEIFSHLLPALKLTVKKPRKIAINLPFLYQNDKIFGGHFFYHNFKGALKGVPGSCFYLLCVTVVWFSFNFAQRQNTEDKFINAIWHGWNRVLFWTGAYPRPKNPRYTPSISVEEQYTRFLFMHKKMLYYITSNRFHFNEKLFLSKKKKKKFKKKELSINEINYEWMRHGFWLFNRSGRVKNPTFKLVLAKVKVMGVNKIVFVEKKLTKREHALNIFKGDKRAKRAKYEQK